MKTKLPRTQRQLDALIEGAYHKGYQARMIHEEENTKKRAEQLKEKRATIRLDALKAATQLASVLGQSIGELTRAMASEADQL